MHTMSTWFVVVEKVTTKQQHVIVDCIFENFFHSIERIIPPNSILFFEPEVIVSRHKNIQNVRIIDAFHDDAEPG